MQDFTDYLLEKQLNIGNKSAYPKFNNVLILAGGLAQERALLIIILLVEEDECLNTLSARYIF